jgi:hypothetical protein
VTTRTGAGPAAATNAGSNAVRNKAPRREVFRRFIHGCFGITRLSQPACFGHVKPLMREGSDFVI